MAPHVRIVLQARFDSRRLAGKAILEITGVPMVVLAARRAARSGMELVVATSENQTDAPIVHACEAAGLSVFRGALEDVYSRYIGATAELDDNAIVVRLTADNVFPDADFIEGLSEVLRLTRAVYVAPKWPDSGLPYGVMAEVFRLGALRRTPPVSASDAEHVTAALVRVSSNPGYQTDFDLAHLRATVDTSDDISRVRRVFEDVDDPIRIGWRDLCRGLAALPKSTPAQMPSRRIGGLLQSQLTLGSAQFGMPYGVANTTGTPNGVEISRIVHRAIDHGVTHIDTARIYGDSEARLGAALAGGWRERVSLITKIAPIAEGTALAVRAAVDDSICQSRQALRTERLDIVLLHRAATRFVAGGAGWQRLLEYKRAGVIGRLGISIQSPEEAERADADSDIDALQLPFNLLDRRWEATRPKRHNLLVHARSVFLQGLLAGAPEPRWPRIPGLDVGWLMSTLDELVRELGRRSMADLAVAFVRAHAWIHSLVLGMETETQLRRNLSCFAAQPLDEDGLAVVRERLPILPNMLLDPAKWPLQ